MKDKGKIVKTELQTTGLGRRKFVIGAGAAGIVASAPNIITSSRALAAGWPERPITVVVMYGAGGGTDTIIRTLAAEMAKSTGWEINVINKPGAVGGVATRFVLNKPDDGYWWLGAANYNKFVRIMGHSDSKAWEDWQYFQAANSIASWSVRTGSPYKTFEDVIAAAKANPGRSAFRRRAPAGSGRNWR